MEQNDDFEKHYTHTLSCSIETKQLFLKEVYKEFLLHNPHMKGIKICQGRLLRRVINYYLEREEEGIKI